VPALDESPVRPAPADPGVDEFDPAPAPVEPAPLDVDEPGLDVDEPALVDDEPDPAPLIIRALERTKLPVDPLVPVLLLDAEPDVPVAESPDCRQP
jgi:hypothetical protein